MKKIFFSAILLLAASAAHAAPGTIYIDTGGCQTGSTTRCSGTTDSATATVSAAAATITCSATTYTGSTPGCSLSGTPDLSGVTADGSQAIFLNCATNANQKIFFITAVDDAADLVQTSVTPTGCTASSSDWGIGGRMIYASANIEAAVRPGDTILFNNSPATKAAVFITARVGGDNTGRIYLKGKTGARPVLETSNTSSIIAGGSFSNWTVQNLEFKRGGVSGSVVATIGVGWIFDNLKISAAPSAGIGISTANPGTFILNSEFTGIGGDAISVSAPANVTIAGNYIHGNGGSGINLASSSTGQGATVMNNLITGNSDRGIFLSGAPTGQTNVSVITGNTVYANGNSGLEVTDADQTVLLTNNIFMNNGNAAGEYNVEWVAGTAETLGEHGYNVFYTAGAGGSGNLFGLTTNTTEYTTDPLFVNAGAGNFAIGNSSPAAGSGFPGNPLGSASTGYRDIGPIQRQVTGSSSGNHIRPGIGQ